MINRQLRSLFHMQKRSLRSQSHCLCHCFTWGKTLWLPQSLLHMQKDPFAPYVTVSYAKRPFRSLYNYAVMLHTQKDPLIPCGMLCIQKYPFPPKNHCLICRKRSFRSLRHCLISEKTLPLLTSCFVYKKTLSLAMSCFISSYAKRPFRSLRHCFIYKKALSFPPLLFHTQMTLSTPSLLR